MEDYDLSNEIMDSGQEVGNAAKTAAKTYAKKAVKEGLKTAGPIGWAAGIGVEVLDSLGIEKLFKAILIIILSLSLFLPVVMVTNAFNISFNIMTHVDDILHKGTTGKEEEELDQNSVKSEDRKYAEIITKYMLEEYMRLPELIEAECKRQGVDYEASSANIVDNTVIPTLQGEGPKSKKVEDAIQGAIDWAVKIADDDSFSYGTKGGNRPYGCYFCGTNGGGKFEKTYVCLTFVQAAFAHGAGDPEMMQMCSNTGKLKKAVLHCNDWNLTHLHCWKKIGLCSELKTKDIEPGDVICWWSESGLDKGHVEIVVDKNHIVDAEGLKNGIWGPDSIAVRNIKVKKRLKGAAKHSKNSYVMRYVGEDGDAGKGSGTTLDPKKFYDKKKTEIAQATSGEHDSTGNKPGDQTKDEVSTTTVGSNWTHVYRIKDDSKKLIAANFAKKAAANDHIGYDQSSPDRSTLVKEAKKVDWDASKIKTNCECSCTELVSASLRAAGFSKSEAPTPLYSDAGTSKTNRDKVFDRVSGLEKLEFKKGMDLYPGDIMCRKNHTAIVIMSPNKVTGAGSGDTGGFSPKTEYTKLGTISKETGDRVSIDYPSGKPVAQSFAYTDGYYGVAFTDGPETTTYGVMKGFDSKGKAIRGSEATAAIYHANGTCATPEGSVITTGTITSGKYKNGVEFTQTNGKFKKGGKVTFPQDLTAAAYDQDTGNYVLSTGTKIWVYDSTLTSKALDVSTRTKHGAYRQDIGAGGGYVFACHSVTKGGENSGENYVDIYSETTGEYCGSYEVNYGELESADIVDGELVLLVHIKKTRVNYIHFTGISIEGGNTQIDMEGLCGSRDVAMVLSAYSVYEAQILPTKEIDDSSFEDAGTIRSWINFTIASIKKHRRDKHVERTLKKLVKKGEKKGKRRKKTVLYEILIATPEEKDGKLVSPLIEINPAGPEKLCRLFDLDPNGKYSTEAPNTDDDTILDLKITRKKGEDYEIGDTDIETAIETNADTHLELIYDSTEGLSQEGDLVLPIKLLFSKIKLSKKFSSDKKGIECKPGRKVKVHASEHGTVTEVRENDPDLGNYIVIEGCYRIVYAHLKSIKVKKGDVVSRNKIIGTAKEKFRMEVYENGNPVDPEPLFIKRKYGIGGGLGGGGAGIINGRRTSPPEPGNKYYKAPVNNFPRNWDAGHGGNCTWYAYGRFLEAQGKTNLPAPGGDAYSWQFTKDYETGKTPKVGSIIVWDYGTGANGHVAFVEEVKPNNDIEVTESAWGSSGDGFLFKESTYKAPDYAGHGTFICFIYPKYPVSIKGGGGDGNISFAGGKKGKYQKYAYSLFGDYGWSDSDMEALINLWNKESGWNPKAENPSGAYGIPQALPGSKMKSEGKNWKTNYKTQIRWGLKYIKNRYGTPSDAWSFFQKNNYY